MNKSAVVFETDVQVLVSCFDLLWCPKVVQFIVVMDLLFCQSMILGDVIIFRNDFIKQT